MIRVSLDLTAGTFSKVEEICRDKFQNKAQYLRMLIDTDMAKRVEGKKKEEEKIGEKREK